MPGRTIRTGIDPVDRLGEPGRHLLDRLGSLTIEALLCFYLQRGRGLVGIDLAHSALSTQIDLPLRDCIGRAIALDADSLIIAHNHPSGDATPSAGDIATTRTLRGVLRPIGMTLADHLIVTATAQTSFRALGLI